MKVLLIVTCLIGLSLALDVRDLFKPYFRFQLGFCKYPALKERFQPEKFFRGLWYEKHSYGNYIIQVDAVCSTTESMIDPTSGNITVMHYQYMPLLQKYVSIKGHSNALYTEYMAEYFPITYKLFGDITGDIPFSILDTDYENWAVVYTCKQQLGFKSEMAWILTRERGTNKYEKEIKNVISNEGLNYENFIEQRSADCYNNDIPKIL